MGDAVWTLLISLSWNFIPYQVLFSHSWHFLNQKKKGKSQTEEWEEMEEKERNSD